MSEVLWGIGGLALGCVIVVLMTLYLERYWR